MEFVMSDRTSPFRGARRFFGRPWRVAGLAAMVAGALALGACSHGPHRGWGDGPMSGQMDPERAARFTEKMADRIVSAVDGTPEQKQKIQAIAQAAMTDLMPLRDKARDARRQSVDLLKAPSIDRAAIETLRAGQIQLADGASKRLAQAMADTAEVLTPDQRVKLAERMQRRMGRWS
jgi:periplasmic protein CpxP/Spy